MLNSFKICAEKRKNIYVFLPLTKGEIFITSLCELQLLSSSEVLRKQRGTVFFSNRQTSRYSLLFGIILLFSDSTTLIEIWQMI